MHCSSKNWKSTVCQVFCIENFHPHGFPSSQLGAGEMATWVGEFPLLERKLRWLGKLWGKRQEAEVNILPASPKLGDFTGPVLQDYKDFRQDAITFNFPEVTWILKAVYILSNETLFWQQWSMSLSAKHLGNQRPASENPALTSEKKQKIFSLKTDQRLRCLSFSFAPISQLFC